MQTSEISSDTFSNHFPQQGMSVSEGPPPRSRRETPSIANPIDDDLMTKIALGDIEAAETFKVRHQDGLVDIALGILDDEIEAERIAEAAIEDACRGWPPQRGQVAKWLRSLTRRRARARRRELLGWDA
jgi:hypothetical protein